MIEDKLKLIFEEIFEIDQGLFSVELIRSDIELWDSLNHLRMVSVVENEFGIKFSLQDVEEALEIESLIQIINKHLS